MTSHVWALLFYALLTIAYTWPVATGLDHLVPHDLGDPMLSTWTLWWNAQFIPFSDRWWEGLAFYPARDTLTFSDHRVGLGWIASPIIWMGGAPLAAYNLAFLLSFFLSAAAAYGLCYSLTKSAAAALIGGLVFGFNPYRGAHLPHLELLSSYWLPLVLLGLHQWSVTLQGRWLAVTSGALVMQALTSGYYFVFLGVLLALWLIWFTPRRLPLVDYLRLGAALGVPVLLAAPVFLSYRQAHQALGLSRGIGEIEIYSADLTGLLTTPRLLALWTSPESSWRSEGELWPGALAIVLIVAGLWAARRVRGADLPRWGRRLRAIGLAVAVVMAGAASIPVLFGPVAYELAGLRLSISDSYKPLSIMAIFGAAWALTSSPVRRAFHGQSPFAFYVLATIAMWVFALGPTARVLGQRFLYKAPYAWLMMLPGFTEGFRVPARFAMLAALTLGVAAALAFDHLTRARSWRQRLAGAALVTAGIAAESWVQLPIHVPPEPLEMPAGLPHDAVVLELPVGLVEDFAAMYRSIHHRRRLVNGTSGFDPPHYGILRAALEENRYEALDAIAAYAPVAIFIRHGTAPAELVKALRARSRAEPFATTTAHDVWLLPKGLSQPAHRPAEEAAIAIQQLASPIARESLPSMLDGDRHTAWFTDQPQDGTEFFIADLGQPGDIEAVVLALGAGWMDFPRAIAIDLSSDGIEWSEASRGDAATMAIAAAISDPREIRTTFAVGGRRARYVRVRQIGQSEAAWGVAEFRVLGR
jgi:hypothetical protein